MSRSSRGPIALMPALFLCLMSGCSNSLQPGEPLTGRYSSQDAVLTATTHGATFSEPCLKATLPTLQLDGNLNFSVQSTSLLLTGNINYSGDEVLMLTGHPDGNQLNISIVVYRSGGPAVDPIPMTLQHNGPSTNLICSA